MPDRRLTQHETRRRLRRIGIDSAASSAFAFTDDAKRISYDWHHHRRHQILYAVRGTARLESADAQFLLPPQRAAWIPAGVRHATHVQGADIVSVYFARGWCRELPALQIFEVPALLREMMLYARRWPPSARALDRRATAFFRALLLVVTDSARRAPAYELPRARSALTAAAMAWVLEHLQNAALAAAARHCHTTPRTLRRRFLAETGLHFRAFVAQARVQRAIELLANADTSVIRVAGDVGFSSPSAFSQAFRRTTGQTPRAFRAASR